MCRHLPLIRTVGLVIDSSWICSWVVVAEGHFQHSCLGRQFVRLKALNLRCPVCSLAYYCSRMFSVYSVRALCWVKAALIPSVTAENCRSYFFSPSLLCSHALNVPLIHKFLCHMWLALSLNWSSLDALRSCHHVFLTYCANPTSLMATVFFRMFWAGLTENCNLSPAGFSPPKTVSMSSLIFMGLHFMIILQVIGANLCVFLSSLLQVFSISKSSPTTLKTICFSFVLNIACTLTAERRKKNIFLK